MKLKLILCFWGLSSLLSANAYPLMGSNDILEKVVVPLTTNDVPFDILTNGDKGDHRSIVPLMPISVIVDGGSGFLELNFEQAVGEVVITISQNGSMLYSSSENYSVFFTKGYSTSFGRIR